MFISQAQSCGNPTPLGNHHRRRRCLRHRAQLIEAMRTKDRENVAYTVILILIVVFVFDNLSKSLRSRLTQA